MWNEYDWLLKHPSPARDIHRGRQGRNTIYFSSIKNRRQIICESVLEARYCIWLEWDRDVLKYFPQPYTFKWRANNKSYSYTADFFVIRQEQKNHFTEVKPDFERTTDNFKKKMEAFAKYANDHLIVLRRADRTQIMQETKLNNLRTLYNHSRQATTISVRYAEWFVKSRHRQISIRECLDDPSAPSLGGLCSAMFNGAITFDIDSQLSLDTLIGA